MHSQCQCVFASITAFHLLCTFSNWHFSFIRSKLFVYIAIPSPLLMFLRSFFYHRVQHWATEILFECVCRLYSLLLLRTYVLRFNYDLYVYELDSCDGIYYFSPLAITFSPLNTYIYKSLEPLLVALWQSTDGWFFCFHFSFFVRSLIVAVRSLPSTSRFTSVPK